MKRKAVPLTKVSAPNEWDTSRPSRGLGDIIRKATEATGIHAAVKAVVGDCGCEKRQQWLNEKFPINREGEKE